MIKAVWYQCKNRHVDGGNRIENQEIKWQRYNHLIFYKRGKNILWENIVYSTNDAGKTRFLPAEK